MTWTRGAAADWDGLQPRGNPRWNWQRALVAYRTIEDHRLCASDPRGAGGPLGVSVVEEVVQAILAAAQGVGWEHVADTNACDSERIGFSPSTIHHGVRATAYSAFVRPIHRRPNLTVARRTRASRLVFDGDRVVGVWAPKGAQPLEYRARKELTVGAGTIESPHSHESLRRGLDFLTRVQEDCGGRAQGAFRLDVSRPWSTLFDLAYPLGRLRRHPGPATAVRGGSG